MSGDWHDMSDAEWEILRPVIPRKHQGPERKHESEGDERHLLRASHRHGPYTTCCNRCSRCSRWSGNGTWASIM